MRGSERRHLMSTSSRLPYRTGPTISGAINDALNSPTSREPVPPVDAELRRAVDALDAAAICSATAELLEHMADRLNWTRGMSIVHRRGDGSLADRWPSVANALRKTNADDLAEQVTRSPIFRDLVAARRNGPGRSASTEEAMRFGKAVLSLLDRTRCADCGQWWSASAPGTSRWTCRCRSLVVVNRPNTR